MQQPTPWQSARQNPSPLGPLSPPTYRHRRLLRTRSDWPRHRRAAEKRDELPPPHSITSSARPDKGRGTVTPSALAVLRLMISSTFVACCVGRSAGFSPLRIWPA